ncbi:MAG TPA: hypothetical protein VLE72_03975, partial [Candidatus Saccharimonadales bacterium]|nr:hypothetical protein [Candidatus Saccharimonadales bacterium]
SLTVMGYISKARDVDFKNLNLTDLTQGQVINLLFGNRVDVSGAKVPDSLKKEFTKRVMPYLPRIANEAIYQDKDLGVLSLNSLEQRASLLEKMHGDSWRGTEEGARIENVLNTVFVGEHFSKAISSTKYRFIVFTLHEKYKKEPSKVAWNTILSIDNYTEQ